MNQHNVEEATRRPPSALERIRANRTGRVALKTGVGLLGAVLIVAGLLLVPLPGPGWLVVIAGLAVLAIEFAWARHLLRFTRRQLHRWTQWMLRQSWPVRLGIGAVGLVLLATLVWASVRLSFGVDLVSVVWRFLTT
ncbi:MAG: TIGR02611 family protein [Actinocatenispora sp.]